MNHKTSNTKLHQCCTLNISGAKQDRLIAMFKALSNLHRFKIMKFLLTHPDCITGDIVDYVPLAQSTISQHLKVLRETGWIQGEVDGPAQKYCLNKKNITWFKEKVGKIF